MKSAPFLVGMVVALFACGHDQKTLTCQLMADPTNCWAKATSAASDCLPMRDVVGALAADRKSCTWPDGTSVAFDEALPDDRTQLTSLAMSFRSADGSECARFEDSFDSHLDLSAGGEDVVVEIRAADLEMECGDTTFITTANSTSLCTPGTVPTDGFQLTETSFQLTLVAVTTPGPFFTCQAPATP